MTEYTCPDSKTLQLLQDIANKLRIDVINATESCKSGHPTTCASIAEIVSVLFFHVMRYTIKDPKHPASDRFVMSKGHACPILYAAWAEAGLFDVEEFITGLRKIDSDFEGHPTPRLNFIDVATGSLGQGIGCAAGMAYTGKYYDKSDYLVYCVLGDGECAEGSVWESLAFASYYNLDNLVAIFDINKHGSYEETMLAHDMHIYEARLKAFGWNAYVVDGHNIESLCETLFASSNLNGKPTGIIAKTYKGSGLKGFEGESHHGKQLDDKAPGCIKEIQDKMTSTGPWTFQPRTITAKVPKVDISAVRLSEAPKYMIGDQIPTRVAYGFALVKLGRHNDRVVVLDADTRKSTYSNTFKEIYPERYIECFIAEQNMVSVAMGCATRDRNIVFCNTFGSFFTRACDQIRMGGISQSNINVVGSHTGISIGFDGPSNMALEDIALFRAIPGSTLFYPSDAVSMERAVELAANTRGICYIRTSRPGVPVIYENEEDFKIGKAKVVRKRDKDVVTVIACGVTLTEAMKAAEKLERDGIDIRLIDPFTVKPLDKNTILSSARETDGRIITVEDHYIWGGLGDCVAGALSEERDISIKKLAVTELPRSGKTEELFEKFGISANWIEKAVRSMIE